MDKSKFGTPAYKGGKDMRRSLDKVQEQSQMTSLLPLYTSNSHSILRHTHPENPLYAQRAFSCVQFNCDIRIKDFQNYNSNIDFSLKIITTFLDFHKDGFKINPGNRNYHLPLNMYLLANLLFVLIALSPLLQLLHPLLLA